MLSFDTSELLALSSDLGKASGKVTRQAQLLVRASALRIEGEAKRFAPVDTGALRNSIGTAISGGGLTAEIAATVAYAPYVEYGTRRMAPRAFMGPAFDRIAPDFVAGAEKLGGDLL